MLDFRFFKVVFPKEEALLISNDMEKTAWKEYKEIVYSLGSYSFVGRLKRAFRVFKENKPFIYNNIISDTVYTRFKKLLKLKKGNDVFLTRAQWEDIQNRFYDFMIAIDEDRMVASLNTDIEIHTLWEAYVLETEEYPVFCLEYFGKMIHFENQLRGNLSQSEKKVFVTKMLQSNVNYFSKFDSSFISKYGVPDIYHRSLKRHSERESSDDDLLTLIYTMYILNDSDIIIDGSFVNYNAESDTTTDILSGLNSLNDLDDSNDIDTLNLDAYGSSSNSFDSSSSSFDSSYGRSSSSFDSSFDSSGGDF